MLENERAAEPSAAPFFLIVSRNEAAVFTDRTDIYFARQQVSERINEAKANLPPGVEVKLGTDLDGARRDLLVGD